jgi:hypothetical protein
MKSEIPYPYLIIFSLVSVATILASIASHDTFLKVFPHQGETNETANLARNLYLSRIFDPNQLTMLESAMTIGVSVLILYLTAMSYRWFREGRI